MLLLEFQLAHSKWPNGATEFRKISCSNFRKAFGIPQGAPSSWEMFGKKNQQILESFKIYTKNYFRPRYHFLLGYRHTLTQKLCGTHVSHMQIYAYFTFTQTFGVTRDYVHPRQSCQKNTKTYKYKNTAVKFEFQINNRYNLNMFQILPCCCSVIKSCPTICNPMNCTMPGFPVHHYLPEFAQFMSIESVMPSNHLILCRPLLLLPLIFPSIRAFSNELALHIRWPKYQSFSFSISTSNEYSGLISFRSDWLNLLAVQRTLKNLLKHYNLKASVLQYSAFFMV